MSMKWNRIELIREALQGRCKITTQSQGQRKRVFAPSSKRENWGGELVDRIERVFTCRVRQGGVRCWSHSDGSWLTQYCLVSFILFQLFNAVQQIHPKCSGLKGQLFYSLSWFLWGNELGRGSGGWFWRLSFHFSQLVAAAGALAGTARYLFLVRPLHSVPGLLYIVSSWELVWLSDSVVASEQWDCLRGN